MISIDASGLSCPEPVIRLKNAIDSGEMDIEIKVNVGAAVENNKRLAINSGYTLKSQEKKDGVVVMRFEKS